MIDNKAGGVFLAVGFLFNCSVKKAAKLLNLGCSNFDAMLLLTYDKGMLERKVKKHVNKICNTWAAKFKFVVWL